jgi:hypothetical protein
VVTTTGAATVSAAVYSSNGSTWGTVGSAGNSYGPVSLQYCESAPPTLVTVSATDATAGEPGSGQGPGTFTFSRTGSTAAPLTVNFTVGGTATGGTDYTSMGTTVAFLAGSGTATATVNVIDDSLVEGAETVVVTLAAGTGYSVGSPAAATVTIQDDDQSGCVAANLVTGATFGPLLNNFTGWQGLRLRVGSSPLEVQSLGRIYVNGNAGNHELRLVAVAGGATVASVIWTPASGVHNQIKYAALAAPVTLPPNTEYNLASQEVSGGDTWYRFTTVVTTTGAATVSSAVYSINGSTWGTVGSAGNSYGPVSLQYCQSQPPPQVALTEAAAGARPSIARITRLDAGRVRLTVSGNRGQPFEILASEDLKTWSVIRAAAPDEEGSVEFTDPDAARFPSRFYRTGSP